MKSTLIADSVGRELAVPEAIDLVNHAIAMGTIDRAAILIEDEALWDQAWGPLP